MTKRASIPSNANFERIWGFFAYIIHSTHYFDMMTDKEKRVQALQNLKQTFEQMLDLEMQYTQDQETIDYLLDQINRINLEIKELESET